MAMRYDAKSRIALAVPPVNKVPRPLSPGRYCISTAPYKLVTVANQIMDAAVLKICPKVI